VQEPKSYEQLPGIELVTLKSKSDFHWYFVGM